MALLLYKIENTPYVSITKYLGAALDTKLWSEEHVEIKRKELNTKLLATWKKLTLHNEPLVYKQHLYPV